MCQSGESDDAGIAMKGVPDRLHARQGSGSVPCHRGFLSPVVQWSLAHERVVRLDAVDSPVDCLVGLLDASFSPSASEKT